MLFQQSHYERVLVLFSQPRSLAPHPLYGEAHLLVKVYRDNVRFAHPELDAQEAPTPRSLDGLGDELSTDTLTAIGGQDADAESSTMAIP